MLANENIWIKSTHGYFEADDPALHGVTESKVDLSKFPYDIDGRNSGFISMNGLVAASALELARGTFHYIQFDEDERTVIWAEYTPKKIDNKRESVYLMKILVHKIEGINYSYSHVDSCAVVRYDTVTNSYLPPWNTEELESMTYAPVMSFIPVIVARCALDKEVEKRIGSLSHLPESKYTDNPNLYWLCSNLFSTRTENYSTIDAITVLPEEEIQMFISKYLENLVGWEFKDAYNASLDISFGDISFEQLASAFAGEVDPNSELGQLVPTISLEDYYIDPKIKNIADLLVLEHDSGYPINTGMLYGPPASGKSTAVMLLAKMLELPYVPVTFNSNISMDDLLGSWQPTEDGKIHFVESMFVQAYQSPSVIEFVECYYVKPGACGDLNTALDETAQITLPNGKIIHRHPSCFIIATMNAGENENEYRAVREQDVSFDRRFEGFKEYLDFFREDVFADMIKKKSGYQDTDEILVMIKVMKDMNKSAEETGDWQTIYPSAIMRWAQHRKYKDIITAARSTILPAASKNLEVQKEIMQNILNNYW